MAQESKRSRDPPPATAATPVSAAPLDPGLYLVATPIGNARDITLRALDVLAGADAIAAEDTRRTRKLMEIHGISLGERPILSYHDRNAAARRPRIAGWLADGLAVAYCSDAGTPLIADPGFRLAGLAIAEGHGLSAVPGASAVMAALNIAGLPTDRFLFAGFPPAKGGARARALAELAPLPATLVFYESPRRLAESLGAMATAFGGRPAAVARELTKRFEEVRRAPLPDLARAYAAEPEPKGEIVVVVGPAPGDAAALEGAADLDAALTEALAEHSVKEAARRVAMALGLPKRAVYQRALELAGK